ncbi:hypothetical protein RchiOBHm_Chr4g0428661 [Rosa chinensis]|uniref:Uncharacterized protein n=1 Tax=Rosa chinensis TaxID=74649 RepID=A0A2P6QZZ5_ROSCH|nr:hypothetical protein RchiOBHm_Chr4g0428661 [Rosa chinensis]
MDALYAIEAILHAFTEVIVTVIITFFSIRSAITQILARPEGIKTVLGAFL